MPRDADVVNHETDRLEPCRPINPGDGLEQFQIADRPVEVEHLFFRRVETGEQHGLHDYECDRRRTTTDGLPLSRPGAHPATGAVEAIVRGLRAPRFVARPLMNWMTAAFWPQGGICPWR